MRGQDGVGKRNKAGYCPSRCLALEAALNLLIKILP